MAERYYNYNSNIISDKSIFYKFIVNEMNKFKLKHQNLLMKLLMMNILVKK